MGRVSRNRRGRNCKQPAQNDTKLPYIETILFLKKNKNIGKANCIHQTHLQHCLPCHPPQGNQQSSMPVLLLLLLLLLPAHLVVVRGVHGVVGAKVTYLQSVPAADEAVPVDIFFKKGNYYLREMCVLR